MLCSRFKQIIFNKTALNNNVQCRCIVTTRLILKQCRIDELLASLSKNKKEVRIMASVRLLLRDFGLYKLRTVLSRSVNVGNVVKRYRRDRSVREVILCFRQAFFRPKRTLLLSATAAYKAKGSEDVKPPSCEENITNQELEALLSDLDAVEDLSRTIYCTRCNKRLVIDKKQPGVRYCLCKEKQSPAKTDDGWEPYMEAEDVVIWRKEYKPGQGLYAYKVYGRYKEATASHFAAVQVDGEYRRVWDSAVAALAVVERSATVPDQAVLHWEVLWPKLFANRDYVYIRRHKDFNVNTKSTHNIFEEVTDKPTPAVEERPSVHSNAKRKAMEADSRTGDIVEKNNKVYVIISKSCVHPKVPESKDAIRVTEYWSHMVVRTLDGADNPGMEFVLTYYDEPAVGGLPFGVAAWATGRAAPAFLSKMRQATKEYTDYKRDHHQDVPDLLTSEPEKVSFVETKTIVKVNEQEMESSKRGPDLETSETDTKELGTQTDIQTTDKSTQTEPPNTTTPEKSIDSTTAAATEDNAVAIEDKVVATEDKTGATENKTGATENKTVATEDKAVATEQKVDVTEDKSIVTDNTIVAEKSIETDKIEYNKDSCKTDDTDDSDKTDEDTNGRWWRYLHPFYYFV